MSQIFDLFGDSVPENGDRERGGRAKHIATRENCNKVMMLLALGWSNERIAKALSITLPTLRKYYFRELKFREVARDRLDATLAMHLWKQVEYGNVGAMREFGRFIEHNSAMVGHNSFYDTEKAKPLGKKQLATQTAQTAGEGTAWGDDLKPN